MTKLSLLAACLFFKTILLSQTIAFETVKTTVYEDGKIAYAEKATARHEVDLTAKTISMFCDDCLISGSPQPITNIVKYEKSGLTRITFAKGEYDFYIYARKNDDDVYTVKKMIVYENSIVKYDYFLNL